MGLTITKSAVKKASEPAAEEAKKPAPTGAAAKQVASAAKQSAADKLMEKATKKEQEAEAKPAGTETVENKTKGVTTSIEEKTVAADDAPVDLASGKKPGDGAEIFVESSYTHNLGDYKSVKVGCSLKLPCNVSEINDVYDYASGWVSKRMTKMMVEVGAIEATEDQDAQGD